MCVCTRACVHVCVAWNAEQENNSYKKNYGILHNESGKKMRITFVGRYDCRKKHINELK